MWLRHPTYERNCAGLIRPSNGLKTGHPASPIISHSQRGRYFWAASKDASKETSDLPLKFLCGKNRARYLMN